VPPLLTLTTDFGLADHYVAAVKGVVLTLARGTVIVDVSHLVAPGDVEQAGTLLAAAAPAFPPGTVHLAVVDPGVGGERRLLVAATESALLVAPDNGLLEPFLDQATAWSAERRELWRDGPGATFHGRDRLAPIAAFLLRGGAPEELGPRVTDPVRLDLPRPRRRGDALEGRVRHVDRFGNLVTDLPSAWLDELAAEQLGAGAGDALAAAGAVAAEVGGHVAERWARHYAELAPDEPGILPGSSGTLELSLRGESLAERWRVDRGAGVLVRLRRRR
jgi:S-adenosylmethionine hydrolase